MDFLFMGVSYVLDEICVLNVKYVFWVESMSWIESLFFG